MRYLLLPFFALASAIGALPADAHHSIAGFDSGRALEIRGVLLEFKLANSHSSFVIEGIAKLDGETQSPTPTRWEIESDATASMRSSGIDADTFKRGTYLQAIGKPLWRGCP